MMETSDDRQSPEAGPGEVEALRARIGELERRLEAADAECRDELDALRESFRAELELKAARVAGAERAVEEVARNFKSTLSWRLTRPIRALRRTSRS